VRLLARTIAGRCGKGPTQPAAGDYPSLTAGRSHNRSHKGFLSDTVSAVDPAAAGRRLEALILQNPYIISADAMFGALDYALRVYARNAQHYHQIMAPFVQHKIDYETWPVSRRIVRLQSRRLLEALARDNE
jgi:hypothetical protein